MGKYASGKHALAISDRSGMAFPYDEMVREWNGSLVHFQSLKQNNHNYNQNQLVLIHKLYIIQDHNQNQKQV